MLRVTIRVNADTIHDIHIVNLGAESASASLTEVRPDARIYRYKCCDVAGFVLHCRDEGSFALIAKVLDDMRERHGHAPGS